MGGKKLDQARRAHEKWLAKRGLPHGRKRILIKGCQKIPELKIDAPGVAPLSNRIPATGEKRDKLNEHLWKAGAQETDATLAEVQRKAKRIAPSYNKGGYEYQGEGLEDALKSNKRR